jgi:hypothetical protein
MVKPAISLTSLNPFQQSNSSVHKNIGSDEVRYRQALWVGWHKEEVGSNKLQTAKRQPTAALSATAIDILSLVSEQKYEEPTKSDRLSILPSTSGHYTHHKL